MPNVDGAIVKTATTNASYGSVVIIEIQELTASMSVVKNEFGDELPIIPEKSRVKDKKILYQLVLRVKIVQNANGRAVSGKEFSVKSNRKSDQLKSEGKTNQNGELLITLEAREAGYVELEANTAGVMFSTFKILLKDAWYQSAFLITGYHVCAESDFSGALVDANGLDEKHKEDFLFSARGIPMQGTGESTDGRYIKLKTEHVAWHRNRAGHPDYLQDSGSASFVYSSEVRGAYGPVTKNHSIAVDPRVIPEHARVEIEGVGTRFADDNGHGIKDYHIDNFLGAGENVVKAWLRGGINGTKRNVKYIGK